MGQPVPNLDETATPCHPTTDESTRGDSELVPADMREHRPTMRVRAALESEVQVSLSCSDEHRADAQVEESQVEESQVDASERPSTLPTRRPSSRPTLPVPYDAEAARQASSMVVKRESGTTYSQIFAPTADAQDAVIPPTRRTPFR